MPASYHISPLISCIIVMLNGSVSDADLIEEQRRMFSDPLFKGNYSRLVDATEVTKFDVSEDTVRTLATAAVERGLRKAALVSNNTKLVCTLMQMYEREASHRAEVTVYSNMADALACLGKSI